jgi:hypothetical protein
MDGPRKDGLYLLLIGCTAFLLLGAAWYIFPGSMQDFRTAYSSARCLLDGCDPYNPAEVLRDYRADPGAHPKSSSPDLFVISHNVYPASEFAVSMPFAALPLDVAIVLWDGLIAACVILASFLMWTEGARSAPVAFGWLLFFFLVNSSTLLGCGNPACLAVSLCIIAVYCLLNERFAAAGIVCLALSLCLKPQDAGLIWLYLLLAGGVLRRRALQTLAVTAAITIPAVLWVAHVSPHWMSEMAANLHMFSHHGGINDPGPASAGGRGFYMITDLQTVFSFYWDNALFYNLASFAVCAPLLVLWAIRAVHARATREANWLGVAAISALSMLPVYHRLYDAKLILLTIPACALLMAEGGRMRRWAILITAGAFVLNGEFVWIAMIACLTTHSAVASMPSFVLLVFPVPLSLLALGSYYLWVYAQRAKVTASQRVSELAGQR